MWGKIKSYCAEPLDVATALTHVEWVPWDVSLGVKPQAVIKQTWNV